MYKRQILNTTTYDTEQLQVLNNGTMTTLIVTQLGQANDVAYFYYNSNNISLSINSNGFVGINKINPSYNLDVNGTINATDIIGSGSNIINVKWGNLIDVPTTFITSNVLQTQNYINSNSIEDLLLFYISSNVLSEQNLNNSNTLIDLLSFYISSNNLKNQNYINSNSIQDLFSFFISSNILSKQNYVNNDTAINTYISSNQLNTQNYINSNSIENLLSFFISSNIFEINSINSLSLIHI